MIIVKGRELLIPENERYIGTNYDTGMENRVFRIARYSQSGTDLSDLTFRVNLIFNSEPLDIAELQKNVDDDYIYLTWTVTAAQVAVTGTVFVCVTGNDTNDTVKWSSFMAPFYTEKSLGEDVETEYRQVIAKVNQEITDREAADATEKAAREAADTALSNEDASLRQSLNAEINSRQTADAALQNSLNAESTARANTDASLQSQIDQIVAPSGEAPSAAEVQNARIGADGVTYNTLGNAIRTQDADIWNGLNHVELFTPSWSKGYYDASDGNKKGLSSNVSATFDDLLVYRKGSYIRIASGYTIDIVRYVGSTTSLYKYHAVGTYYFTEDVVAHINLSKSNGSSIDYTQSNSNVKIYRYNGTETSKAADVFDDYIDSKRYLNHDVVWQYGYYDGSSGSLGGATANVSVCTINTIDVEPGDYIVAPATVNYFVHKFVGGTWQSMILQRYGTSGFAPYVFEESMSVKIAASWNNSSAIADIDAFVSNLVICRRKYNRTPWAGKRIAWFGTSIPAGQVNGYSYPSLIGDMLGATVYNEALGESSVRSGNYNYVTESDPNGYSGVLANVLLRSLGLSSTEKQSIFDNWSAWKSIIPNAPETIDATTKTFYKNCSYDIKLDKYLQGGSVGNVDAYVFDHGYNDAGADYDYASIAAVPTGSSVDSRYFIGAMNKLIQHILDVNPKAVIIIAGHYENTIHPSIAEAQQTIAETWSIPIIKTWEETGWSVRAVNTGWYWNNSTGKLDYSTNSHIISTKDLALRDGIHPHSDYSGSAIRKLASIEGSWFRNHEIGY